MALITPNKVKSKYVVFDYIMNISKSFTKKAEADDLCDELNAKYNLTADEASEAPEAPQTPKQD